VCYNTDVNQPPVGYQVKGILSGFTALYAIFTIGCAFLAALPLVFKLDSWKGNVITIVFGVGFVVLVVYAVIRERNHPETFATKQTQEVVITITPPQVKSPQGKRPKVIVSNPVPLPLGQGNKPKALKP
jgi:hypothetical protein